MLADNGLAQSPNWAWAKGIGDLDIDRGVSVAVDGSGNVYTTGYFQGTVQFGSYQLVAAGDVDIFIAKANASGTFLWAISIGGADQDFGWSIAVDDSNNVYTLGSFSGTVDFNPGADTNNLISSGGVNSFFYKLDSAGNFIWAKAIEEPEVYTTSLVLDTTGNIYISGEFAGTCDFDPGNGIYDLTSVNLFFDIFVAKYDNAGNIIWAKGMGGATYKGSYSTSVDAAENVYTTGWFQDTVDFDPGAGIFYLYSPGVKNIFISKLDSAGNFVWAKSFEDSAGGEGFCITIDHSANVYTTGYFLGTADFDPGAGTYYLTADTAGYGSIFISKLDSAGNFVWAKAIGNGSDASGTSIAIDDSNNVYYTGWFWQTADFDPDTGVYNLVSNGEHDVFISKLDSMGNIKWAKSMGGAGDDWSSSIAFNVPTDIYVTGHYYSTSFYAGTVTLINADILGDTPDLFIAKLDNNIITGTNSINENNEISIYPNPAFTFCNFTSIRSDKNQNNSILTITDLTGRILLQQYFNGNAQLDFSKLANGVYVAEVKDLQGFTAKGKIVKQ